MKIDRLKQVRLVSAARFFYKCPAACLKYPTFGAYVRSLPEIPERSEVLALRFPFTSLVDTRFMSLREICTAARISFTTGIVKNLQDLYDRSSTPDVYFMHSTSGIENLGRKPVECVTSLEENAVVLSAFEGISLYYQHGRRFLHPLDHHNPSKKGRFFFDFPGSIMKTRGKILSACVGLWDPKFQIPRLETVDWAMSTPKCGTATRLILPGEMKKLVCQPC